MARKIKAVEDVVYLCLRIGLLFVGMYVCFYMGKTYGYHKCYCDELEATVKAKTLNKYIYEQ